MGCGGSKPPDATDASASDESFKDPTAAAEALENDAPPISRSPGATSASEIAVSVSDPGSSASAGAPATEWPSVAGAAGDSFNKGSSGQAKRSLDERELRVTRSHVIGQPPRAIDEERRPLARARLTVGGVAGLL